MSYLRRLVLAILATSLTLAAAWADDEIERRTKKDVVRGTIQSESPTEVAIKSSKTGTVEKVPVNDIDRVSYDGSAGLELRAAELLERSTDYKAALERYAKAAVAATGKDLPSRAVTFGQARALAHLALGDPARRDEAIKAIEAFQAKYGQSRHHFPAYELLGRLHMAKGNSEAAKAAFAELKKSPFPDMKIQAAVFEGRLLMAQGQLDAAISTFDQIAKESAQTDESKARQTEAVLAKAECLAQQKKYDDAETLLQQVIQAAAPEDAAMQAAAHNTLGDVLRGAGKAKDALLAYLYVDLICPTQKTEHPRALLAISQLWEEVGQPARADDARAKLRRDYADTPWGKQVEGTKPAAKSAAPKAASKK
jgi:tetratricopeptide (TPR) repeat protein